MAELIPVVNEEDEIIGHKNRDDITSADIYRVSALWITNSRGDILLSQRKFTKKHNPGKWGPAVAGTVEKNESYYENILKEMREELGITGMRPAKNAKVRVRGKYNHFDQLYTLVLDRAPEEFTIEEDAVEQIRWYTPQELEHELRDKPAKFLPWTAWAFRHLK